MGFRIVAVCLLFIWAFGGTGCSRLPELMPEPAPPKPHEGLDAQLANVILAAGNNGSELRKFIEAYEPESTRRQCAEDLVKGFALCDAAGLQADELQAHMAFAFQTRKSFAWARDVPIPVFVEYVLSPRVSLEPHSAWREAFFRACAPADGETAVESVVSDVKRWVYGYAGVCGGEGPFLPPLAVLKRGEGTPQEVAVVMVAALRSLGIPARIEADKPGRYSFWVEGQWIDADIQNDPELRAMASRRQQRLRHYKGNALAWWATQVKYPFDKNVIQDALVGARGNWREVVRFLKRPMVWRPKAFAAYLAGLSDAELAYFDARAAYESVQSSIAIVDATPKRTNEWEWFVRDVLPDSIVGAPLDRWRIAYDMHFSQFRQLPIAERAEAALSWLESLRTTSRVERGRSMSPTQILRSGKVFDKQDLRTAFVAIHKVLGLYGRFEDVPQSSMDDTQRDGQ